VGRVWLVRVRLVIEREECERSFRVVVLVLIMMICLSFWNVRRRKRMAEKMRRIVIHLDREKYRLLFPVLTSITSSLSFVSQR